MTPTLRFGILGGGRVAQDLATGLTTVPEATLVAVASRTTETSRAFAAAFPGVRAESSYDALVEADDVDVVYVATPHHLHAAQTIQVLEAGKHALCEKPFTMDAAEARRVVEVARGSGRFCMEAMWMRFMPVVRRAKELIDAGAIGDPRLLHADFGVANAVDPTSRFYDPAAGGGAILDRGVYGVSLATLLFGRPEHVAAGIGLAETGVDEHAGIVLGFERERLAVLSCSLSAYTSNRAVISGTHGSITIAAPFFCPARLSLDRYEPAGASPGSSGPPGRARAIVDLAKSNRLGRLALDAARPAVRRLRRTTVRIPLAGNGYGYEVAEVVRCVRGGHNESDVMPLDESVMIMEVLDKARAGTTRD